MLYNIIFKHKNHSTLHILTKITVKMVNLLTNLTKPPQYTNNKYYNLYDFRYLSLKYNLANCYKVIFLREKDRNME